MTVQKPLLVLLFLNSNECKEGAAKFSEIRIHLKRISGSKLGKSQVSQLLTKLQERGLIKRDRKIPQTNKITSLGRQTAGVVSDLIWLYNNELT